MLQQAHAEAGSHCVYPRLEGSLKSDRFEPSVLSRAPLFAALSEPARSELAAASRSVVLGPGEALWRQGAPAVSVGLLIAGRCKMVKNDESGRGVIVNVAVPGDLLGTIAFSLKSGYSSTVTCLRRARVVLVPALLLRNQLKRESHAVAELAADLAMKVTHLMGMIQSLSAGNVQRRLASVLVALAERAGEPFPGGILVPLRLRRADLAVLSATTLESASRTISSWKRKGLVMPMPAGYLLRDLAALRAVASGQE